MKTQPGKLYLAGPDDRLLDCGNGSSYISAAPDITPTSLLTALQELQQVKYAEPKGFDLEQECAHARERLRVSIEANTAYTLKQFNKEGQIVAWNAAQRHNSYCISRNSIALILSPDGKLEFEFLMVRKGSFWTRLWSLFRGPTT